MPLSAQILSWLEQAIEAPILTASPKGGGCINQSFVITDTRQQRYFFKTNDSLSPSIAGKMFTAESEGLFAIHQKVTGLTPRVIAQSELGLLLEYRQAINPTPEYWQQLGQKLALLHADQRDYFGFTGDNFCGKTPQINTIVGNGFEFFALNRILFQSKMARDDGLIDKNLSRRIEKLSQNLDRLLPDKPAVLIHGDLWSGNCFRSQRGPVLCDPACYYGWAEADLAMTLLFGGFEQGFYDAYQEDSRIGVDWKERAPIYNLYHLLNHLNLFGKSYLSSVGQIVDRFA